MNLRWPLPLLRSDQTVTLNDVWVEYEGPQIATWKIDGGTELLGVASDDDDKSGVRWLAATLTHTEKKALADGAVSVRDVIDKDQVLVFDVDHDGHVSQPWQCSGESLQDEHLPEVGARLPRLVREELSVPATVPELCLERVRGTKIAFRAASEILDVFQRLWRAIAQSVDDCNAKAAGAWSKALTEQTELTLIGASTGSLVLLIGANDASLSTQVAAHLDALARAGAGRTQLATLMASLGPRVQGRYSEMLFRLQAHDLVMLYRSVGSSSFLSGYGAGRIISALPAEETTKAQPVTVVGSFRAFDNTAKRFSMRDDSDELYEGDVEQDVIDRNDVISVGDGAVYAATLLPTLRTSVTKVDVAYSLTRVELLPPAG